MQGVPDSPSRDRIGEVERKVEDYRREVSDLERRLEPGIALYEGLRNYGIDRYMLPLLQWFAKLYEAQQNGRTRSALFDTRLGRIATLIAIVYGLLQFAMLALVLYDTIYGVHRV